MAKQKSVTQAVISYLIMASVLLLSLTTLAQIPNRKIQFSSVNQAGLLTGSKGEAGTVQTINGIKSDKCFAGVGAGFDFYNFRTIPLFVDFRRDFSANKNTPFGYVDAGVNFLSLNSVQKEQLNVQSSSAGFYYDLGLGWKLSGKNNRAVIVSAGYTLKQAKYKVLSYRIAPTPQLQSEDYDRYNYLFRRIVIKIGFQL